MRTLMAVAVASCLLTAMSASSLAWPIWPGVVEAAAQSASAQQDGLPLAVDGSVEPHRISDALAYRHLLSVLAQPRSPSVEQVYRRDTLLRSVGLGRSDYVALISALDGTREDLAAVEAERVMRHGDRSFDVAAADALRARERQILDSARARVLNSLSREGVESLARYMRERVKRHIKVYGSVPSQ